MIGVVDFLLPPACAGCGEYLGSTVPSRAGRPRPGSRLGGGFAERPRICGECLTRLREPAHPRCPRCHAPRGTGTAPERPCPECQDWPPILERARAAAILAPPADALVHALKYGGWPELAGEMASRMVRVALREGESLAGRSIVPVPTTARRLRRRGYNQARALAVEVAREGGGELVDALVRGDDRGSQVALQPGERRANVFGAFSLSSEGGDAEAIQDRDLILIDDVLTTGATAAAAAEALGKGGARTVILLTFARALPT